VVIILGFKAVTATLRADDVTNSATISLPATPTPSGSPTASATATSTASPTATPSTIASPTGSGIASPTPLASPSASPGTNLVIWGYGPADSLVKMTGIAVSQKTHSDEKGYFEFKNLTFPAILSNLFGRIYPEICFQATDDEKTTTYPVCIPSLPLVSPSQSIGPIILPPTLRISKNPLLENSQMIASGKTLPVSPIFVHLAKAETKLKINLVSQVEAFYISGFQTQSDEKGHYEFSLPTASVDVWKLFVSTAYQNNPSPKSNTLTFSVKPPLYNLVQVYQDISFNIKHDIIMVVISIEVATIIVLLFIRLLQSKRK